MCKSRSDLFSFHRLVERNDDVRISVLMSLDIRTAYIGLSFSCFWITLTKKININERFLQQHIVLNLQKAYFQASDGMPRARFLCEDKIPPVTNDNYLRNRSRSSYLLQSKDIPIVNYIIDDISLEIHVFGGNDFGGRLFISGICFFAFQTAWVSWKCV